jgi:hypothetical protein
MGAEGARPNITPGGCYIWGVFHFYIKKSDGKESLDLVAS